MKSRASAMSRRRGAAGVHESVVKMVRVSDSSTSFTSEVLGESEAVVGKVEVRNNIERRMIVSL